MTVSYYFMIVFLLALAIQRMTHSMRRFYLWSHETGAAAATAEADAQRARINALQAQMNPHFLFNALNTVASLVGTDGERARRTVRNLSGMLRHTLERSAEPMTTVNEELGFVRDYLDIERERAQFVQPGLECGILLARFDRRDLGRGQACKLLALLHRGKLIGACLEQLLDLAD